MIEHILSDIWLKPNEIRVYLALLRQGTSYISRIVSETKLPKSTVYDTLEKLEEKWLINSYEHAWVTRFTAEDPQKIEHILSQEARKIRKQQEAFSDLLPQLYGIRNEQFSMPKIRLYQGEEGMKTVLDDTLSAHEIIYTYVNAQDMETYFKSINDPYAQKRVEKNIRKRVFVEDTPWSRDFLKNYIGMKVSEVKFLPPKKIFHLEMNIYDGKVTYLTYRDKEPIGIIIEDRDIYEVQRALFETLWSMI